MSMWHGIKVEFESEIVDKAGMVSVSTWGGNAFSGSNIIQYKYNGVDFFVNGIPIDISLGIPNKGLCKISDKSINLHFGRINFGIRHRYKFPVLVIGFDSYVHRNNYKDMVDLFYPHLQNIMKSGMDFFKEHLGEAT